MKNSVSMRLIVILSVVGSLIPARAAGPAVAFSAVSLPGIAVASAEDFGAGPVESLDEMMAESVEVAKAASSRTAKKATTRDQDNGEIRVKNANDLIRANKVDPTLARARSLAASGQYQDASKLLFQMSRSPKYDRDAAQIKYILGLMLYEMKLYQSAAFVFYDVVRHESRANPKSKYLRQSLEKIALAADQLNSDVLLRYAIKQIQEDEFPAASRDMLHYRLGEISMQEKNYAQATREFVRVPQGSRFYYRARYRLGLALAEAGSLDKAQLAFEDLAEQTAALGVTDQTRVAALLGRARVLYQKHQFENAIEAYRNIPRDTEPWHEALFESSWAMLRDGRFRSALSNFHSLHSAFYEDFYQPESLFLRAIVYLYICKYDEMSRVIDLFEKQYKPVSSSVRGILENVSEPLTYYKEMAKIQENFDQIRRSAKVGRRGFRIPFIVARQILKEGDVRRTFEYLDNLDVERTRYANMPANWRGASVGMYVKRILDKRIVATETFAGRQIRHHLAVIQNELRDLFEQTGFLKFEMISSKKESLRKEIAGKGLEKERVDQDTARNYYIQNGYEYWPFTGEYWLDEIGNYQYVGVKSCE